jgi:hypothetical protein
MRDKLGNVTGQSKKNERPIWTEMPTEGFMQQGDSVLAEYDSAMAEGGAASRAPARQVACVIWHKAAAKLRPELLAALNRPGFSLQITDHPIDAVASVLSVSAAAVRAGERKGLVVLVLVEPESLPDALEVSQAMYRYAPAAVLWLFDPAGSPQLRAVRSTDIERWRAAVAETPVPEIHVVVQPSSTGVSPASANSGTAESTKLLSDEDLSMSLDAEPRESGDRPPSSR